MHILFLLVVLEYRLEHILRVGDLFAALVADMAHAGLYERRLQLFIVAVLHVPQHERRKAVFLFQAFQRIFVHAAGGDQHKPAGLAGIFLDIDLRDHAAVAGPYEHGAFDAELPEKGVHARHELLICAQLLRIVKKQDPAVT